MDLKTELAAGRFEPGLNHQFGAFPMGTRRGGPAGKGVGGFDAGGLVDKQNALLIAVRVGYEALLLEAWLPVIDSRSKSP